jgi:phage gpG-like protein
MPVLFSFKIKNSARVLAGLSAIRTRVQDLTPFWRDVFAPYYFGLVQEGFDLEADVERKQGWEPLSPTYAAWKAKHFPNTTILVREGRLRESVRWDGAQLGPDGVFLPSPQSVVVGTNVPYGRYHQRGTDRMPARPFLPTPRVSDFAPALKAWLYGYTYGQGGR